MKVAYIRVSSWDQRTARQEEELKKFGIEKWFIEKVSGKNMDRPKLKEMIEFVRSEDEVHVLSFDRLARSTKDLLEIIETLKDKEVALISHKENLDTSTPTGKMLVTMIGAINEFERENILERQRQGIALAKERGAYKGRQKKEVDQELFEDLLEKYNTRQINKVQMAKELGVSRPKLDKLLKEKAGA